MFEVLPILLIFLSGYIFRRFKADISDPLVDFVLYFIFPIFIIYKIHFLVFDSSIFKVIFIGFCAFTLGIFFTFVAAKIFNINKNSASMMAISVGFGNTSFLGFAFVQAYYGEDALSLAIFYDQIATMVLMSIFAPIIFAIAHKSNKVSTSHIVKAIFTFPPTVAFILAILSKLIVFPDIVVSFMSQVSLTLVPIVIFAVGMKFTIGTIKGKMRDITLTLLIKMLLLPLSLYFISVAIFDIDLAIKVSIIESAMPPMVLGTIIAIRAGLDEKLGLGSLGIGMILSFVTIPAIVYLMG